jgi:hypothetical protein
MQKILFARMFDHGRHITPRFAGRLSRQISPEDTKLVRKPLN